MEVATKPEIRRAVEQIWGVHVQKVNTMRRRGKAVRRRADARASGQIRAAAIVTLASGEKIEIFEGA